VSAESDEVVNPKKSEAPSREKKGTNGSTQVKEKKDNQLSLPSIHHLPPIKTPSPEDEKWWQKVTISFCFPN
jgi:hypothetical protein